MTDHMACLRSVGSALRKLTMMARTSGHPAGRDNDLAAACDEAEQAISLRGLNDAIVAHETLTAERDQLRDELESFNESVQEYMTAEMEYCNHESAGINAQPVENLRRNAKEAWRRMESASFDIGSMLRKTGQQPPIEPIPGTADALAKLTIRGG